MVSYRRNLKTIDLTQKKNNQLFSVMIIFQIYKIPDFIFKTIVIDNVEIENILYSAFCYPSKIRFF